MSMKQAMKLYEEFHKYDASEVGEFPPDFELPKRAQFAGPALYVLYRSSKYDPITYNPPDKPISYIHEHEDGVKVYWCNAGTDDSKVPKKFSDTKQLVCLGKSLGFGYIDEDGDEVEVKCDPRNIELYSNPQGNALFIVEDREEVIAIIWGGKLRVEPRGIVG